MRVKLGGGAEELGIAGAAVVHARAVLMKEFARAGALRARQAQHVELQGVSGLRHSSSVLLAAEGSHRFSLASGLPLAASFCSLWTRSRCQNPAYAGAPHRQHPQGLRTP